MAVTKRLIAMLSSLLLLLSAPVMAHSADHKLGAMAWLVHILSSDHHLLGAVCLAVLFVVACIALRTLRMISRQQRDRRLRADEWIAAINE